MDSPCIKVCIIDEGSGLCAGCHRTLEEIARWAALTDGDRRRIMAELPGRASRHAPAPMKVGVAPWPS